MFNARGNYNRLMSVAFGGVLLVVALALYLTQQMKQAQQEADLAGTRETMAASPAGTTDPTATPAPPADQPPSRVKELRDLARNREYAKAYDLSKELLYSKSDREAGKEARERIDNYARALFQEKMKTAAAEAEAFFTELKELKTRAALKDDYGLEDRLAAALRDCRQQWQRQEYMRIEALIKAGNHAQIEPLIADLKAVSPDAIPKRPVLEYLAERWKEAYASKDQAKAAEYLAAASDLAAYETHNIRYRDPRRTAIDKALGESMKMDELLKAGDDYLARKQFPQAVTCLMAAKDQYIHGEVVRTTTTTSSGKVIPKTVYKGGADQELIKRREPAVIRGLLGLAREALDGKIAGLPPDTHSNNLEALLTNIIHMSHDVKRALEKDGAAKPDDFKFAEVAWRMRFELMAGKAERLMDVGDDTRARTQCEQIMTWMPGDYLEFRRKFFAEDIWSRLPQDLWADLQKAAKDEEKQLFELKKRIRAMEYTPDFPQKKRVQDAWNLAEARVGLQRFERRPQDAFPLFRAVLRRDPESTGATIIKRGLFRTIQQAHAEKKFEPLYELAAFYIGELAPDQYAPEVRDKLADAVDDAAQHFGADSMMKRVFMLSLLADLLPDQPRGQAARTAATQLGFDAVAGVALDKPKAPVLMLPSPLPGHSVLAVDNATRYHLLVFFKGPETFYARLNPYRRGSVVLKDGAYLNAVIVTADTIRPYKGDIEFKSRYQQIGYQVVTRTGKGEELPHHATASGPYTLLRTPPGMNNLVIAEPQLGLVKTGP